VDDLDCIVARFAQRYRTAQSGIVCTLNFAHSARAERWANFGLKGHKRSRKLTFAATWTHSRQSVEVAGCRKLP
jgi:hypothetical protein